MPPPPVQSVAAQELMGAAPSTRPRDSEEEVMGLFDQLGGQLLRSSVSFSLSEHDGEEIVQEAFPSLFRHLRMGKSRRNLQGWCCLRLRADGLRCREIAPVADSSLGAVALSSAHSLERLAWVAKV